MLKDYDLAFISKAENFRIPIFGRIIRKCCFMAIDRENPRNAIKTIEKAAGLIEKDEVSVAVYPESTRSKECVLLPFHNGVFKIAQKANVPIVICALTNSNAIKKNMFRRRTDVYLDVIDVLQPESFSAEKTLEIGEQTRTIMERGIAARQAALA